jgi:hypothetical protein
MLHVLTQTAYRADRYFNACSRFRAVLGVLGFALAGALGGCGSGGSGPEADTQTPSNSTVTLVGVISKGPLSNALVTAYPVDAKGVVGSTEIAHTRTTDAAGNYRLSVGSYVGAVQIVATAADGTTSADEATGKSVTLPAGFTMRANTVVKAVTSNQDQIAAVTPYTELANTIAAASPGGITSDNIVNANGVVFNLIGVNPVATVPVASNATPPAGATTEQLRYGLFNAAVSKLAVSAPTTTDAATLACYNTAGSDAGLKIQCATKQIASAVTVSTSGGQAVVSGNTKLVGLTNALAAVSADASVNKTGVTVRPEDSALKKQEDAAASGTPVPPIPGGTQASNDVTTAKLFFSNLRSNATAMKSGSVSSGIGDGMQAFGDSLSTDGSTLTTTTINFIRLVETAQRLWVGYTTGVTTNPNSVDNPDTYTGCTVYQGTFPTNYAAIGTPFISASVAATAAANASWVACSSNTGPLFSDGRSRYRQVILLNMGADPKLASIPYSANTRSQYVSGGKTYQVNLTTPVTGTAGFATVSGSLIPISLVGDLPPAADAAGTLLAQRYPVNIAATVTTLANGATQATFSSGKLGVVPVGGTSATLTIDLSADGGSSAVIVNDTTNAAQVAAAQVTLAAAVSEPNGVLKGSLAFDKFKIDTDGSLQPDHIKFTGSIAVAPVVAGNTGAVTTWTSLTLESTNGTTPVLSFSGTLNVPTVPTLAVQGSITQTSTDHYTLQASYKQNGLNVTINGTKSPTSQSVSAADASGVAATVTSTANLTDGQRAPDRGHQQGYEPHHLHRWHLRDPDQPMIDP